jgi:acetoin:2,6-dichlorophenolindophenol oxidoreductase subunit alpha
LSLYTKEEIYEKLLLIRKTELKIESLFRSGVLRGTTHGCIGQESIPVALSEYINLDNDYLTGGHRSHGYAIAFTNSPVLLLGELMGKKCGFESGMGGSQHIHYKNLYTNGITGGMVPVCAGLAFALKQKSDNGIAVACLGDGSMNEGYVLETLNLSCILSLPILFVLENNGFAMSTSVEYATFQHFSNRIIGFGLRYSFCIANDYDNLKTKIGEEVNFVRLNRKPAFIEIETHRFSGHSKSDKREYISKERESFWLKNDCISKVANELSPEVVDSIENLVNQKVEESYNICLSSE